MPGRQWVTRGGLAFRAAPGFWLRRWTHFPFFFESHNASFRIEIRRYEAVGTDNSWSENKIPFDLVFADNTKVSWTIDVPSLQIGKKVFTNTQNVYVQAPGQVKLRIPTTSREFLSLYSYHVRSEESLWLAFWGIVALLATVASPLIVLRLQKPPVVNVPAQTITVTSPTINITTPPVNVTVQAPPTAPASSTVTAGNSP